MWTPCRNMHKKMTEAQTLLTFIMWWVLPFACCYRNFIKDVSLLCQSIFGTSLPCLYNWYEMLKHFLKALYCEGAGGLTHLNRPLTIIFRWTGKYHIMLAVTLSPGCTGRQSLSEASHFDPWLLSGNGTERIYLPPQSQLAE